MRVNWTPAVDDGLVTAYRLYKDGAPLVTMGADNRSFTLTGLMPATQYQFHVEAGDAAGNWSMGGPSATFMTSSVDRIRVVATDGRLALPFTVSISGRGGGAIGAISFPSPVGTVEVNGVAVSAVVYERQPWPDFGYTLYQVLAVESDRWYLLWFYCSGTTLSAIYYEGTDGTPLTDKDATGTCSADDTTPSSVDVRAPEVDMPVPPLIGGYVVTGTDIELNGAQPGFLRIGTSQLQLFVFGEVDCTQNCGSSSWYELHAILWDEANGRACAAILYLTPGMTSVNVEYTLTLPNLSDPTGGYLTLNATWMRH
jgi:hypothetical protein